MRIYFILVLVLILQACAAVVVTTGVTGATMAHDKRTTGTFIEDQAIEFKASQALHDDEEISKQAHFNIISFNTIVLVTGEVPTETLRQRIIDIVSNIEKVTHVHNEITIAAPSSLLSRSSDTAITAKVKTKLIADEEIEGTRVKIVTEKGVVYLMGLISRTAADKVVDIVRKTGGVQKVVKLFQYTD